MATLDSTSTLDDIKAAYADNASFEEDRDVSKAKSFVTACRLLLLKMPRMTGKSGGQLQLSPELIQREMTRGLAYVQANDTSSTARARNVMHPSFRHFRD